MKKVLLLLFALLSVVILIVVFNKKDTANTIKTEEAEITVADHWQEVQLAGAVFAAMDPEPVDGVKINVNLVKEDLHGKYNVAEYKEGASQGLRAVLPDIEFIESKDNWHIVEYAFSGVKVRQVQFFYVNGETAYVLTFTSSPGAFGKNEKLFRDTEKTFKLK